MTDRRTRRVEAELKELPNGEHPWAEVVEDLTWGELKALREKAPLDTASYDEAGNAIARYVVGWNIPGRNVETGEMEAVAPPAEAGAAAFDCVEPWVISWLFVIMHRIHMLGEREKKEPTPIGATPDGKSASA